MQRLESMLKELEDLSVGDDEDNSFGQYSHTDQRLPPGFENPAALPIYTGPVSPPTPPKSTKPMLPNEPIVRITLDVWDAMSRDLDELKQQKRVLENRLAQNEKQVAPHPENHNVELQTEIGKLKYQNEVNKTQKVTMARTLSDKDVQIKQLQLDLNWANERLETAASATNLYAEVAAERDCLQAQLKEQSLNYSSLLSDRTEAKDSKIKALSEQVDSLQKEINQTANAQTDDYKALAQNRLDQLTQREKTVKSTKAQYAAEQRKVRKLEEQLEDLHHKLNRVGDLEIQLDEKTQICDRLRASAKAHEKALQASKQSLDRATDAAKALHGAAHLVKPRPDTKLSTIVLSCAVCYTKNITCDNKSVCRNCSENNEKCVRWRCSLKHILGNCPRVLCTFPHETDGWLLASGPRPEW